MKLAGFAVRALVILSLLCNGIGSAYAMATMHASSTHAGCHEGAAHKHEHKHDAGDRHPAPKRSCCGSEWCACPCTGLAAIHAPAAFTILPMLPAVGELARAGDFGYASPRLSNLLRPPIV